MRRSDLTFGFLIGFTVFIAVNLLVVHLRSVGGLFEGLGVVDRWQDDIRQIGFPFQFFEEGGFSYRREFNLLALALDILVGIAFSAGIAILRKVARQLNANSLA